MSHGRQWQVEGAHRAFLWEGVEDYSNHWAIVVDHFALAEITIVARMLKDSLLYSTKWGDVTQVTDWKSSYQLGGGVMQDTFSNFFPLSIVAGSNLFLLTMLVSAVVLWVRLRKNLLGKYSARGVDAPPGEGPVIGNDATSVSWSGHLQRFTIAFFIITALVGLLLLNVGWAFEKLKIETLSDQSLVGLIAVWIGAPVAFASAMYAIYLAHAALELAKGQNRIAEKQLQQDKDNSDPNRLLYQEGVNSLLDLDSSSMNLVAFGHLQLNSLSGATSDRDALRAQLAAILTALNSAHLLQIINRTQERQKLLELSTNLRSLLYRANAENQTMPLRADYPNVGAWRPRNSEWALRMAEALSAASSASIKMTSSLRRALGEMRTIDKEHVLPLAAGADLTESRAKAEVMDVHATKECEIWPKAGVIEIIDDGESLDNLLLQLRSRLGVPGGKTGQRPENEVQVPEERNSPDYVNIWSDWIRDRKIAKDQFIIFNSFEEFRTVFHEEGRRCKTSGRTVSLGDGVIIIIDTPYGAESQSTKKIAERTVAFKLAGLEKPWGPSQDFVDLQEPDKIWKLAKMLAGNSLISEELLRIFEIEKDEKKVDKGTASSEQQDAPAGHVNWSDMKKILLLLKSLNPISADRVEDSQRDEVAELEECALPRNIIWIALNLSSSRQLDGIAAWAFDEVGQHGRYAWSNDCRKLQVMEVASA